VLATYAPDMPGGRIVGVEYIVHWDSKPEPDDLPFTSDEVQPEPAQRTPDARDTHDPAHRAGVERRAA